MHLQLNDGITGMLTVEYDGVRCHFDDSRMNREQPGSIWTPMLTGRFYEEAMLGYIRSLGIAGCYVDVGSNIGTHALFFAVACPASHVYAFEPRGRFYDDLLRNVKLNDVSDLVTASPFALADRAGVVTTEMMGREFRFEARRLDNMVRHRVAVLKLDVEGMEPAVLAGGPRVMTKDRPVVFAEAGTEADYHALEPCLADFDYRASGRVWNATPTYEFLPLPSIVYSIPGASSAPLRRSYQMARSSWRGALRRWRQMRS